MEIESYYAILCEIKEVIIAKVEELVAKSLPKKKKVQDYEGAKLLGLKASEME